MRIGILTFHGQLNYGGVLQCWALRRFLCEISSDDGDVVEVVDRWLSSTNVLLRGDYSRGGLGFWLIFIIRSVLGIGGLSRWIRHKRTQRFLKRECNVTPYHFCSWSELNEIKGDLPDVFVVGSDQVWHGGDWGDPAPYLLIDAPNIPAIAYAASFGMRYVPDNSENLNDNYAKRYGSWKGLYAAGLNRFKSISCREDEGVEICKGFGINAEKVLDPTMLLKKESWDSLLRRYGHCPSTKRSGLVCYFIDGNIEDMWPLLMKFAKAMRCPVKVFSPGFGVGLPRSLSDCINVVRWVFRRMSRKVQILDSAGPVEFVSAFSNAEFCLTDSFHALSFSTIYGLKVRVVRPSKPERMRMFSRLSEIEGRLSCPIVSETLSEALNALKSDPVATFKGNWLEEERRRSTEFLAKNLAEIKASITHLEVKG